MLLKRFDKKGNKYYINAFTGMQVPIPLGNPLKREPNAYLQSIMDPNKIPLFGSNLKEERSNKQNTAFIGNYKRLMRMEPGDRNISEFIKACRRINLNPWPLMNTSTIKFKKN